MSFGIYVKSLVSELTPAQTISVLQGIQDVGLLAFLERSPLGTLEFSTTMDAGDFFQDSFISGFTVLPGSIDYPHMAVRAVSQLPRGSTPLTLENAGKLDVLTLTESLEMYIRGVFVHELAHHIIFESAPSSSEYIQTQFKMGRPVSKYAKISWEEYFCESLVAHTYHPDILERYDATGYKMIKHVLAQI